MMASKLPLARRPDSRGFTLIELLASVLAGSLLLLWLGWAVGGIGDQWARGAEPAPVRDLAQRRLAIAALIEESLYPLPADDLPVATDRRLTFVTVPPRAVKGPTLARLTLTVEPENSGRQRLIATLQDLKTGRGLTPPSILAHGWQRIRLASEDSPPEGLRPLVEIGFRSVDGEEFAILARPKINVEPGCEFDPISLECRP